MHRQVSAESLWAVCAEKLRKISRDLRILPSRTGGPTLSMLRRCREARSQPALAPQFFPVDQTVSLFLVYLLCRKLNFKPSPLTGTETYQPWDWDVEKVFIARDVHSAP